MNGYEYIRIELDFGDLDNLNSLASTGWRCVSVVDTFALLERQLSEEGTAKAIEYYTRTGAAYPPQRSQSK